MRPSSKRAILISLIVLVIAVIVLAYRKFDNDRLQNRLLSSAIREFGPTSVQNVKDHKEYEKITGHPLISYQGILKSDFLTHHKVYIFQYDISIPHSGRCALAYSSKDDEIFSLTTQDFHEGEIDRIDLKNFQRLIKSEIEDEIDESKAQEILKIFLSIYFIDNDHKLLNDSTEIELAKDKHDEEIPLPENIQQTIHPLKVESSDGKDILRFFTWGGAGGILQEWKFFVEKDGIVNFEIISSQDGIGRTYSIW